jgi:hypothetical protein
MGGGVQRQSSDMPHQRSADTLPLILIEHCESDLGCPRVYVDIPSAA